MQTVISTSFAHCTVLTIAHRLGTILNADRILVIERGKRAEFDRPAALMQREGSIFRALVHELQSAHAHPAAATDAAASDIPASQADVE
jgi:ABC-type multidrug transport system fused ATPase/permease subunit